MLSAGINPSSAMRPRAPIRRRQGIPFDAASSAPRSRGRPCDDFRKGIEAWIVGVYRPAVSSGA